jgi:hypothetical protein
MSLTQGNHNGTTFLRQGSTPGVNSLDGRPSVVTATPGHGMRSNISINHHYLTRRTSMGDNFVKEGQLVFIYKQETPLRESNKSTVLLNLPMLNYHLADDAQRAYSRPLQACSRKYSSAEDVLDQWCPQGIIVTEVGSANSNGTPQMKQCRIINCTVAGWASTFNIWGGVADGDLLSLTLKQVEITPDQEFVLDPSGSSAYRRKVADSGCIAWQFIPTTSDYQTQPGECQIHLGRVFRSTRVQPYQASLKKMSHDLHSMCQFAPQFEVLFNVHRPILLT